MFFFFVHGIVKSKVVNVNPKTKTKAFFTFFHAFGAIAQCLMSTQKKKKKGMTRSKKILLSVTQVFFRTLIFSQRLKKKRVCYHRSREKNYILR